MAKARVAASSAVVALSVVLLRAGPAMADPVDVINSLRLEGCRGETTTGAIIAHKESLDRAARELSRNRELDEALDRHDYPAASASSYHVRGSARDSDIRNTLEARFCDSLIDARYDESGYHQDGDETWIVLAVRVPDSQALDRGDVSARLLALVNAARARGQECGNRQFDATHPLTLSSQLTAAAGAHARDMAVRGTVTHAGSDGSRVGERTERTGYAWRAVGENVAGGQPTADAAFAAWLASPGHCSALMSAEYTEMGVAVEPAPEKDPDVYWVMVFADPRE